MKTLFMSLLAILMMLPTINVMAADDGTDYSYELTREGAPISRDPNYVIFYVYSYGKRKMITSDLNKRNAVHGIMFKGLQKTNKTGAIKSLVSDGCYECHQDYFDRFFNNGDYLQYIQQTNTGWEDVMQVSSKVYKVGIEVKVNIKALKQRLVDDGIEKDYRALMM